MGFSSLDIHSCVMGFCWGSYVSVLYIFLCSWFVVNIFFCKIYIRVYVVFSLVLFSLVSLLFSGIDHLDEDLKVMAKKKSLLVGTIREFMGVTILEKTRKGNDVEGSGANIDSGSVSRLEPDSLVQEVGENPEEHPLQKKKLRRKDGSHPNHLAKESVAKRAEEKRLVESEGVPGLGEIDETTFQEYESSLLDIPSDKEKYYYLGLGYDDAFKRMIMTWGLVMLLHLSLLYLFLVVP